MTNAPTLDAKVGDRIRAGLTRAREEREQFDQVRGDFRTFLSHWQFRARETGEVLTFDADHLWESQLGLIDALAKHHWLFALKAGKLGLTEVGAAYDAWRAFSQPGARVSIFSKGLDSAKELLRYIKFGLTRLPSSWGIEILSNVAGGDTDTSIKFRSKFWDEDDTRTIVSFAATDNASIDQTVVHAHLDELAHLDRPERLYASVTTTIVPDTGTLLITTRGAGEGFVADLFRQAANGEAGDLGAFFAPYWARPNRDAEWRELEAAKLPIPGAIDRFAPVDAEDALRGDAQQLFVEPVWWLSCRDASIPPLLPKDKTPLVLGVDAGVTSDTTAIVAVSRHHVHHDEVSVRAVKIFDPKLSGGVTDFDAVERWIRDFCATRNAIHIAFDSYQLVSLMQRLEKDRVCWVKQFAQQGDRVVADSALRSLIIERRIHHYGDPILDEHVINAGLRPERGDSGLRIVKLHPARKVDACVALSMAVSRCRWLVI